MTAYELSLLHKEAQENFQAKREVVTRGKNVFRELTRITEVLDKLENLNNLRISSSNDCGWMPGISDHEVRAFVYSTLEKRRMELCEEFNKLFGKEGTT